MECPVRPKTSTRRGGGWLATAPRGAKFAIGTVGETEQEATERFYRAWEKWENTLNGVSERP